MLPPLPFFYLFYILTTTNPLQVNKAGLRQGCGVCGLTYAEQWSQLTSDPCAGAWVAATSTPAVVSQPVAEVKPEVEEWFKEGFEPDAEARERWAATKV